MNLHRAKDRNAAGSLQPLPFAVIPGWRLETYFPWIPWTVGWLAIFKGVLWLSSDPVVTPALAGALTWKFILTLVPFVVFGIGVWNLRRWAAIGLIAVAAVDLLFYLVFPASIGVMAGGGFWALAAILLVFNGPAGDVLILLAAPSLLKHSGRKALARRKIATWSTAEGTAAASQPTDRGES